MAAVMVGAPSVTRKKQVRTRRRNTEGRVRDRRLGMRPASRLEVAGTRTGRSPREAEERDERETRSADVNGKEGREWKEGRTGRLGGENEVRKQTLVEVFHGSIGVVVEEHHTASI